jgi:hypothetical protein
MSDCNFCRWQSMKRRGDVKIANRTERKKAWHAEDDFNKSFGPGVVVINKETGEFVSWFMELPERCCC